jgi:5-methylcytosine-specific restriction protein A
MPSHRCKHPTCTAFIAAPGYCQDHAGQQPPSRHTHYDQHQRDREMKAFYDSAAWQRARSAALARQPWCQRCGDIATTVHHRSPAKTDSAKRLDPNNLVPMCAPCHSQIEAEARKDVR